MVVEVPATEDNQFSLAGTFPTFTLKVDRTAGTGVKTIKLRARTRGFVTKDQDIEFIICPN
jgi:hypothetical protein